MNDLPRHTLARIIAKHGRGICAAPKRVEALLKDLAGAHRREINIIVGALEERVAADLIAAGQSVPRDVLLARLAARLRDHLAYTPEAARWGVETWAVALGVLSEAELQERARAEAEAADRRRAAPPPPVRPAPPPVREPQPPSVNPPSVTPRPPRPQRGTTHAPPPPRPQPPTTTPPPTLRPPAPVQRRTPAPPPPRVTLPAPPRQHDPHPSPLPSRPTPRRGLSLRGCFVLFVLIAVLVAAAVFVVPVVIGILQEEQARPSINEPRIR